MKRITAAAVTTTALVAALLAAWALPAAAATPAVSGSVGPGFTISMAKKPTKAGLTKFTVSDKASSHNFHLYFGTGSSRARVFQVDAKGKPLKKKTQAMTEVGQTGTKAFYVTLKKGTYTFLCDPHLTTMVGTFTVK
jgi:plastocyanin